MELEVKGALKTPAQVISAVCQALLPTESSPQLCPSGLGRVAKVTPFFSKKENNSVNKHVNRLWCYVNSSESVIVTLTIKKENLVFIPTGLLKCIRNGELFIQNPGQVPNLTLRDNKLKDTSPNSFIIIYLESQRYHNSAFTPSPSTAALHRQEPPKADWRYPKSDKTRLDNKLSVHVTSDITLEGRLQCEILFVL
ncbi:hypothetical protein STEG23_019656 [Scotinomys teguina]